MERAGHVIGILVAIVVAIVAMPGRGAGARRGLSRHADLRQVAVHRAADA